MAVGTQMLQRRATEAVWSTSNHILSAGELGVTTDTGIIKIGDGANVWTDLNPAFGSEYLPILGKAADSELLDGISASGFYQLADATTTATANKLAKRLSDGRLKAVTATESDDLTTLAQQTTAISDSSIETRKETVSRTVTAATTLAASDVNKMVMVNHSSLTAQVVVTVPTNTAVAMAVGSWIDICAIGAGGVKITPAAGVTVNWTVNVFPSYGLVRILKTATDTWMGIALSNQRQSRLPKARAVRTGSTGYTANNWIFVPYDILDSTTDFYNPDNEWFSAPAAGLPTGRRIIANKTGEYLVSANFISGIDTITYVRLNLMVSDNTLVGGRVLASQSCHTVSNLSARVRLTAGQGVGTTHLTSSGSVDQADGSFDYRNDLTITRIGD